MATYCNFCLFSPHLCIRSFCYELNTVTTSLLFWCWSNELSICEIKMIDVCVLNVWFTLTIVLQTIVPFCPKNIQMFVTINTHKSKLMLVYPNFTILPFFLLRTTLVAKWLACSPRVRLIVCSSTGRVKPRIYHWYVLLL